MSLPGPLIAIVGPTASGKSALAELVAYRLNSSVISIDAMQVYRGMDIGTAKVPVAERACPLLMVDVADIHDDYSVKLFQHDARNCVDGLLAEGKTPVLCGGTGLYLDAVIDDMRFPAGENGSSRRSQYEMLLEEVGAQGLHELLRTRDAPSADLIHPNNTRRVIRALEMLDDGTSYAEHHKGLKAHRPRYETRLWGVLVERDELYARINERVTRMFEAGLVDEVRALREQGLAQARTASQAIGYKEVLMALAGDITLERACELIQQRTRQYAKRQLSWIKRDGRVRWIDAHDSAAAAACIVRDLERSHEGRGEEI